MRKLSIFLFVVMSSICPAKQQRYQQNLMAKNLVGVWQYGSPQIGDQLNQSFVFFDNGNFYFLVGKHGDDLVSTINLKGHVRLVKNNIFFTIISRGVIESAKIGLVNSKIDFGIFEYKDIIPKVILEKDPKEIEDPAIITFIQPNHIKINDEDYYKVSSNPNDASKL